MSRGKYYGTFEVGLNAICIMMWPGNYGDQGVEGNGLNENSPHMLICLDTSCPVNAPVWEGLGNMAILEEFCYCRWSWRF